jgi:hypothetical protein
MVSIIYNAEETSMRRYKATIDLKGTAGAKHAPFGTGADSPHVIGFGFTPTAAINDAYRSLGEFIYSTKVQEVEPEEATPAP